MICITCATPFSPPANCPECGWDANLSHFEHTSAGPLFNPGDTLASRYSVQQCLGVGRFGICYKAIDLKQNTQVAIKLIHPAFVPTSEHQKRFIDGMIASNKDAHPNTAKLLDAGNTDNFTYFATEFLDGGSLEDLLSARVSSQQCFALTEIYPIIKETVACLIENPHGKHGVLCPRNIYIQSGNIKILDHGLVENLPVGAVGYRLLSTSLHRRFVAPELLKEHRLSPRSDVFSLGVILGELLTLKTYSGQPEMFREAIPELSQQIDNMLQCALAEDRRARYSDVEIFLSILSDIVGVPTPRFQRAWDLTEDSVVQNFTDIQEDKTAQIIMKDVIQQHYEEVTAVRKNPLLEKEEQAPVALPKPSSSVPKPSAVALPKPSYTSQPAPPSASLPKPSLVVNQIPKPTVDAAALPEPPHRDAVMPKPPKVASTPIPQQPSIVDTPKIPAIPVPPRPSAIDTNHTASIPIPPRPSILKPPTVSVIPAPPRPSVIEPPKVSAISVPPRPSVSPTDVQKPTKELSDAMLFPKPSTLPDTNDTATQELLRKSDALNDVNPRFVRAAHALESQKIPPAPEDRSGLKDINPRFIRAAKTLRTTPLHTQQNENPAPLQAPDVRNNDDWRNRISQETSTNEESIVSFLAPPPSRKTDQKIPRIPPASLTPVAKPSSPQIPSPPPPPPRPKN